MAQTSSGAADTTRATYTKTIDPDGYEINPDDLASDLERDEKRVQENFFTTLKRALAFLPFAEEVVASYYCALDGRTPARVRAVLLGALVYFIMPFDAVPDFLVGLGFTDDVSVLATAIYMVRQHITAEHRAAAQTAIDEMRQQ